MKLGEFLFRYRSYTPIPLIILVLVFSRPTLGGIIVGYPMVVCGELLRLWSAAHIGGSSRSCRVGAQHLVTTGPYGYIRNPLYLGNVIIACGETIAASSLFPIMLLVVLAFLCIQYALIIPLEEGELSARFPRFVSYRKNVRRIIPRAGPYGGEGEADWRVGLRSERATLILRVVLLAVIVGMGLWGGDLSNLQFATIFG